MGRASAARDVPSAGAIRNFSAPRPTTPRHNACAAGAATMPSTGRPSTMRATLTVYSSRPATSSRVPSSGSTSTNSESWCVESREPGPTLSSEITGTPGSKRASPASKIASEASSALVTGELSSFIRTANSDPTTAKILCDACATRSLRAATSPGSRSRSISALRVTVGGSLPWRFGRARCITNRAQIADLRAILGD